MNRHVSLLIVIFVVGFAVGFLPIFGFQSNEITSLRTNEQTLVEANDALAEELAKFRATHAESDHLEAELSRLLLQAASGGGVNMKMMPHPDTGELTVELPEVFSFDSNHAFCRVDTNREAFVMPTYQMGDVLIEENEFFMAMSTTSIDEFKVSRDANGFNSVTISGGLDCVTEVAKADMRIGSREAAEYAEYKIKAVDAGLGGGEVGDTFEFTVYFDPDVAPINYAIFGPEFTFTGDMIDGEITIPSRG